MHKVGGYADGYLLDRISVPTHNQSKHNILHSWELSTAYTVLDSPESSVGVRASNHSSTYIKR